jgi:dihydrolipoamide dehydrogenase
VGSNALLEVADCFDRRTRLSIMFTDPEIAVVGARFDDTAPSRCIVGLASLAGQGRWRTSGSDTGPIKVYAKARTAGSSAPSW